VISLSVWLSDCLSACWHISITRCSNLSKVLRILPVAVCSVLLWWQRNVLPVLLTTSCLHVTAWHRRRNVAYARWMTRTKHRGQNLMSTIALFAREYCYTYMYDVSPLMFMWQHDQWELLREKITWWQLQRVAKRRYSTQLSSCSDTAFYVVRSRVQHYQQHNTVLGYSMRSAVVCISKYTSAITRV